MSTSLEHKHAKLQAILAECDRVLVAFSGGVDSTLVARVAHDVLGERALAVTAASPSLMQEDLEEAMHLAELIGIRHQVIETHELDNPDYSANPTNRCYFCKSELHGELVPLAAALGIATVLDGANLDDLGDYRPGFQAAREKGVRSPLIEAQMSKLDVRQLSRALGLPTWDKPAMPCLASRFPYGEGITQAKLLRLAAAERYVRGLGERQFRVRSAGDAARLELPPERIKAFVERVDLAELVRAFQNIGFSLVTLDLEGFRSGKLNAQLNESERRRYTPSP